jgi:hypothetical protein
VLVISFAALGFLWKRPLLEAAAEGQPLPPWAQRIVLSPITHALLGALGFALLVLVWVSAVFGTDVSSRNLAPTFIYIAFWLGLVPVTVLFGDVFRALNPWLAAANGTAWIRRELGWREGRPIPYPRWLGRWPAAILLFCFSALELAWVEPSNPRHMGIAVTIYSVVTWIGMAAFGRQTWVDNGEAFSVYFSLLARIAPFAVRERDGRREAIFRAPLSGLGGREDHPGTFAFVVVMLGSVAFDGFSRTTFWQDRYYNVQVDLLDRPGLADLVGFLMNLGGLLATILIVAGVYLVTVAAARWMVNAPSSLAHEFVPSLIPIALAYAIAHYFSLLVLQSQYLAPLFSDPLGKGWNLIGLSHVRPDLAILPPNAIWYVQVGALVLGHAAGLMIAHDRAVSLFDRKTALWTQYPMLALMVTYTVGGLWLLSQG